MAAVVRGPTSRNAMVGGGKKMQAVRAAVRVMADSDSTVVIAGESGTGKEVTARLIHDSSRRRSAPFVPVSCAVFADSLVESELFGHERGAFTGAVRERPGRFELADGGTLFLDDIDDVPLSMQVKLLRVIQERKVERIGAARAIPIDVRIIAGTKRSLKQLVLEGRFRDDLFYRLSVLSLHIPALRERREDIADLTDHFLDLYYRRRGQEAPGVSSPVRAAFMRYDWPGNVRELENTCERIAQTCTCEPLHLGCSSMTTMAEVRPMEDMDASAPVAAGTTSIYLDDRLLAFERSLIHWALERSHGNRSEAAQLLHIKRSTLSDRIRRCGLAATPVSYAGGDAGDPCPMQAAPVKWPARPRRLRTPGPRPAIG